MEKPKTKLPYSGSELATGFLVVGCAAVLIGLLFLSAKSQFLQKTYPIHLRFNYISGLAKNAPVHYAGHEIGKVTGIQFVADGQGPKVQVTTAIREDAKIEKDATAYINIMGFMGETYVEITTGTEAAGYVEPESVIVGSDPIPMMQVVKKATEITEEFEKLTKSLNAIAGDLSVVVDKNQPEMDAIFSNLNVTTSNLKDMTEDLKSHPWKLLKKGDEK